MPSRGMLPTYPYQMMGLIQYNNEGVRDVQEAAQVFVRNEQTPLQERMKEVNDWIGKEAIRFKPYELLAEEKP